MLWALYDRGVAAPENPNTSSHHHQSSDRPATLGSGFTAVRADTSCAWRASVSVNRRHFIRAMSAAANVTLLMSAVPAALAASCQRIGCIAIPARGDMKVQGQTRVLGGLPTGHARDQLQLCPRSCLCTCAFRLIDRTCGHGRLVTISCVTVLIQSNMYLGRQPIAPVSTVKVLR